MTQPKALLVLLFSVFAHALLLPALHASPFSLSSNSDEVRFPAGELSRIAAEYAGGQQNWPVVSRLAVYSSQENAFTLDAAAVLRLSEFKTGWEQVQQARQRFSNLVAEGGRVFAPESVNSLDDMFIRYRELITEAAIEKSIEMAGTITEKLTTLESEIRQMRNQETEARLAHKVGEVDRRPGLIASWQTADIGALFQRSDGIRTGAASEARLVFLDGSDVFVSEETIATIRESNLDRLTNRSEVEIELSSGSLLTRLSASGQNQSNYRLNTGNTVSSVRSNNFWTENREGEQVSMSNFDGQVTVEAGNAEVELMENQGTIVRRGQQPLAPIELLPAPELRLDASGSVIYDELFELQWTAVEGAAFYEVSVSPHRSMDRDITSFSIEDTRSTVPELTPGEYYVQVRAYDENGLRGRSSQPQQLLRIEDTIPPALLLDAPDEELRTFSPNYVFTGTTEPGARLTVNGREVPTDPAGRFEAEVELEKSGRTKEYELRASDRAGNVRSVTRHVRYIDENELFQLRWSTRPRDEGIQRARQMLVSGQAYSFMNVQLNVSDQLIELRVGTNGSWAIQFEPGDASQIELYFVDRDTGQRVANQTYELVH